jgi:hypothetical protein
MLSVFSINATTPPVRQYLINEGIVLYKVNEIKKMFKKFNPNMKLKEAIDVMLEFKHLTTNQTGTPIFTKSSLNQAKNIAESRGYKLDKKQWKELEKLIDSREKKFTSKIFFRDMSYNSGIEFDEIAFESFYEDTFGKDDDTTNISLEVTVGVTLILCGVFMYTISVQVPFCATIGTGFIEAGCYFLGAEGWEHIKDYVGE